MAMDLTRNTVLSIVYGLKNQLHYEGYNTAESITTITPVIKVLARDQAYKGLSAPSIVVYPASGFETDLQIGGGYYVHTLFTFDIYASKDGEMYKLVDVVRRYLETTDSLKIYEGASFPEYQVLDDKVRETYSGTVPSTSSMLYFSEVRVQYLDRATLVGETRAHRAQVTALVDVTTM
jgi:hypothetical protein